jgi:hypothetical protein
MIWTHEILTVTKIRHDRMSDFENSIHMYYCSPWQQENRRSNDDSNMFLCSNILNEFHIPNLIKIMNK